MKYDKSGCKPMKPKSMPPTEDSKKVGKGGLPTQCVSPVTTGGKIRTGKVSGEKGPK